MLYKLTDENDCTHGSTQWGPNVTHTATGQGELCGPGWIHAYTHPLLAVLLNPIHADFRQPHLWEATGKIGKTDHGLKVGCRSLTTRRQLPLPAITTEQHVRFAILCALVVYRDATFCKWADDWLCGRDRSAAAAWAAEAAAAAAEAAAKTNPSFDLIALAVQAIAEG